MASTPGSDGIQFDSKPGGLPPHLLTTLLITALVLMGAWLLLLTKRVTQLELARTSPIALQDAGDRGPGAPMGQGQGEGPPRPMGAGEPGGGPPEGAEIGMGEPPSGGPRGGPGGGRSGVPGMERVADDETFEARRTAAEEALSTYLGVTEFEPETAQALRDEVARTFDAMVQTRTRLAAGEISERERRAFLQSERLRVMENVQEILGQDEASIFLEEVMGVPEQAQRRMGQRPGGEEPPVE
jgi:hypothetical protein